MIAEAQVPELYDSGYWYAVQASTEEGLTLPESFGADWSARYGEVGGITYAAVRSPIPRIVGPCDVTDAAVLTASGVSQKFFSRIKGE